MTLATPLPPLLSPGAHRTRTTPTTSGCRADRHGTEHAALNRGCCCADAVEALRLARGRRRTGRALAPLGQYVDATGTRRRLQALIVIGHSTTALAEHLQVTRQAVADILTRDRVHPATSARVAAIYGPLSAAPPTLNLSLTDTDRGYLRRAIDRARALGYMPPLAWDDVDIDDPHVRPDATGVLVPGRSARDAEAADILEMVATGASPDRMRDAWKHTHPTAQTAVVASLSAEARPGGALNARVIAEMFGIAERTAVRHRGRHRAATAAAVEQRTQVSSFPADVSIPEQRQPQELLQPDALEESVQRAREALRQIAAERDEPSPREPARGAADADVAARVRV